MTTYTYNLEEDGIRILTVENETYTIDGRPFHPVDAKNWMKSASDAGFSPHIATN